jgi:thioredoxin 1
MALRLDRAGSGPDGVKWPQNGHQLSCRRQAARVAWGYRCHGGGAIFVVSPSRADVSEFTCPFRCHAPGHAEIFQMSSELIKHVTDDSFDADVLKSDKPVLVDYWAEWCGPCKMIAPILDEVSKAYDGRLQVAKMNVDENRVVPAQHNIRGIPTLMLFKGGVLAATKVGALNKAQLTAFIDGHL